MMLPAFLVLLVLAVYPLYWSVATSFRVDNLFNPAATHWAGLGNYAYLLNDDDTFWQSIKLTIQWCASVVSIEMILGFALALLLDTDMRGAGILRTAFVIPVFIAPVALGLTWRFMFEPVTGVLNYLLVVAGLGRQPWHTSPETALVAVMIPEIWEWMPFVSLILLAGMQSISPEIIEAARLDGIRGLRYVFGIVVPLLWPVIAMVLLLRIVDSIRIFDLIYVITRGGPGSATLVASVNDYTMFQTGRLGTMAAYGLIIVLVIDFIVIFFIRILYRQEKQARVSRL